MASGENISPVLIDKIVEYIDCSNQPNKEKIDVLIESIQQLANQQERFQKDLENLKEILKPSDLPKISSVSQEG